VPVLKELCANLLAWFIVACLSGFPVLGYWFFVHKDQELFPPRRSRLAPWSGFEVFFVFFVAELLVPELLSQILTGAGFFRWLYGPGFDRAPLAAEPGLSEIRRGLWLSVFAFPFQLVGILTILRSFSSTRLYQLGLTTWNAGRSVIIAWLAWLVFTLPLIILHILAVWGFWVVEGTPPEEHPLARLAEVGPSPIEWVLIVVSSILIAPVMEELLFRRVLQGWASGRPWGGPIILFIALTVTFGKWLDTIINTKGKASPGSLLHDVEPILFVLILAPGCFLGHRWTRRWLSQPYAARAIYSTALLFAIFHPWPTPLPLFLLGLALGWVAYRTQTLLAPIAFHALFNSVACMVMLLDYTTPANGKEVTSAWCRPSAASTASIVPGSWLPRRTYASAIDVPRPGDSTEEVTWPTSLSPRKSLAPAGTGLAQSNFKPTSERLTWP
jgi:membrane protease YdiL (CAAX protease family)